jgi:predicted transcriptional regulator
MVERYVRHYEKREEFRAEAFAAWNDYKATGLHATVDEADAWLAKLEAGEEAEAPECHV